MPLNFQEWSTTWSTTWFNGRQISDHLGQRYKIHSRSTHLFNFFKAFHIPSINHPNIHLNFTYFATNAG